MDHLGAGVGVLELDDVDILWTEPGRLVGGAGCVDGRASCLVDGEPRAVDLECAQPPRANRRGAEVDRGVRVAAGIFRPAQDHGSGPLVGAAEHVLRQGVVQQGGPEDLLLREGLASKGVRVEGAVPVVLGGDLGERRGSDVVVLHVLVDLHPEELGGDELAQLAVPLGASVQTRVGAERTPQVLVHADGDAEVVLAQADGVGGQREGAGRRRTPVVDVGERDPRQTEESNHRVGVVDLVAAGEGELDLPPFDACVCEGAPDRHRSHVDARHTGEAAERVQAHSHDGDVHPFSFLTPPVRRRTSRPRCPRRRCETARAPAPSPCPWSGRGDRPW